MVAMIVTCSTATVNGQTPLQFRGIPTPTQGNQFSSPASLAPYYYDLTDDFNRDSTLVDTKVDGYQIGYVPPFQFDPNTGEPVPDGPLAGLAEQLNGQWMGSRDYVTSSVDDGFVSRSTGIGPAVTCLPWRVHATLGKQYLVEMTAEVALGETVRLGYFGDVNEFGTAQGLDGQLGQLILGLTRVDEDTVTWEVAWDDNGQRVTATGAPLTSAVDEQIRFQLAWDDIRSGNDTLSAWVETGQGNINVLAQNMNTEIDVFGAGFELSGTGSRVFDFVTAVPEPTGLLTTLCGLIWFAGIRRRFQ